MVATGATSAADRRSSVQAAQPAPGCSGPGADHRDAAAGHRARDHAKTGINRTTANASHNAYLRRKMRSQQCYCHKASQRPK